MWGALQREPRPAAAEDVASQRSRALQGRGGRLDGRRPDWALSNTGMQQTAATHVLLDPTQPGGQPHALRVRVRARGLQVHRQRPDLGAEEPGIAADPRNQPFAWRITRAEDGTLYLVVARRSERGASATATTARSTARRDGAETWERMPLPEGANGPNGLTVDPPNPQRLYLAAWGVTHPRRRRGRRRLPLRRRRRDVALVLTEAQHVYDVTVDPRDPRVLYACGFDPAA